ncbi:putative defensin-like protein 265 [Arabidopsis thaliana]|uniref:Putative defensin-like protein 265 n=4 Tax=Arabidopsis TaxID=3701 RepID=DF265_ARATH|nr:Putative membrane lipoprotein [Arabidopsis thaliana]Q2V2W2.1 RecName: Full=Putative defensin-like protein 265; Flags: Precursor [Arabidopsis thaliana]KAG7607041.1 hypothetical protein ISN45_At05g058770 [Arabidopsis thaliana x Arabidopsis arenosa]KAG7613951.1 hypothetical protein ISN44_As05g057980 [Arabidopsis suecica]AED97634.1 Putative membrane lipoprotein [Arabidopsis thaliana]OAO96226.1 hypothetical protein AXX17_AT5G62160 [Arabidopsis thaliana]CAA0411553.1 unnamed protein product [Arab|eukprot:NP_001032125.1 Putative membrane lipoprotein [Arabidopsis thaliana]
MEKTVSRKVVVLAILLSLSCLCIAKASKGEEKTSGELRDVTPQRGGPCSYDNLCHNHCPGCKITQCVNGECVCLICYTPPL